MIPGDTKGGFDYKDKDIATVRTEQNITRLGVDCEVEFYSKNEYKKARHKISNLYLGWADNVVCIKYNYPDSLREQVKFIYKMLYAYYLGFQSYSDAYLFIYRDGKYVHTGGAANIEPIIKLYVYLKDSCRFGDIDESILVRAVHSISYLLPIKITEDNISKILNIINIIIKHKRKHWII